MDLGKPSKKIKSVDFFHARGVGVNPKSTLLKKGGFLGGGGGLGSNFHTFLDILFF